MKRLIALFLLSVGLGLAGLYLATREAVFSPAIYRPTNPRPALLVVAAVATVLLWTAPVAKLTLLARAQKLHVRPGHAFLAHVAQVFGTAMTPSGTGGGPALVMALERVGVPVGTGLGIAVQLFVLDLAALGVLIPVALLYLIVFSPLQMPPLLTVLAAVAAVAALVVSVLLVRFPRPVYGLIRAVARWRALRRFEERLSRVAREYYVSAVGFRDMPLSRWSALHVSNFVAWLANFTAFWAALAIYGAQARLLDVLSVLSIITLFAFFVPTPGASGFMELLVGLSVNARSVADGIAAPVVAWRAATFYVAYLLGPLSAWLLLAHRPPAWLRRRQERRRGAPGTIDVNDVGDVGDVTDVTDVGAEVARDPTDERSTRP